MGRKSSPTGPLKEGGRLRSPLWGLLREGVCSPSFLLLGGSNWRLLGEEILGVFAPGSRPPFLTIALSRGGRWYWGKRKFYIYYRPLAVVLQQFPETAIHHWHRYYKYTATSTTVSLDYSNDLGQHLIDMSNSSRIYSKSNDILIFTNLTGAICPSFYLLLEW